MSSRAEQFFGINTSLGLTTRDECNTTPIIRGNMLIHCQASMRVQLESSEEIWTPQERIGLDDKDALDYVSRHFREDAPGAQQTLVLAIAWAYQCNMAFEPDFLLALSEKKVSLRVTCLEVEPDKQVDEEIR